MARKYGITLLPTLLFLDKNGKIVGSFVGYKPPQEFIAAAKRAMKKGSPKAAR